MSTEGLIRKGLLIEKKQTLIKAIIDGKAALQALLNEAMHAKGKSFESININTLNSHLEQIKIKKAECDRLSAEIMELE